MKVTDKIPEDLKPSLDVLITERPLSNNVQKPKSREKQIFDSIKGEAALLSQKPSLENLEATQRKLQALQSMYSEAAGTASKQFSECRSKDGRRICFSTFFYTRESRELKDRKILLEQRRKSLEVLLKQAEVEKGRYANLKTELGTRFFEAKPATSSLFGMDLDILKRGLPNLKTTAVKLNDVRQNSLQELFIAVNVALGKPLNEEAIEARVREFGDVSGEVKLTGENVQDLSILKFCSADAHFLIVDLLKDRCKATGNLFVANSRGFREIDISVKDAVATVNLKGTMNLARNYGEKEVATVDVVCEVLIDAKGAVAKKCQFGNITPLPQAGRKEEEDLLKVFTQKAKVTAVAKS